MATARSLYLVFGLMSVTNEPLKLRVWNLV